MRYPAEFTFLVLVTFAALLAGCAAPPLAALPAGHLRADTIDALAQHPAKFESLKPATVEPAAPPKLFSVVAHQQPVAILLFTLARDAKVDLDVHPAVTGDVTLNALQQTLPQILDRMARQVNLRWQLLGGTLIVEPDTPYTATYPVDYFNLSRRVQATVALANSVTLADGGVAGGSANSSTTLITSQADNLFWAALEANLRALLKLPERPANKPASEALLGNALVKALSAPASKNGSKTQSPIDTAEKLSRIEKNLADTVRASGTPVAATSAPGPDNLVLVHAETGTVTVFAASKDQHKVAQYLAALQRSAQRQVLIEATVVEVALNDQYQAGVDWRWLAGSATGWQLAQSVMGTRLDAAPVAMATFGGTDNGRFSVRMLEEFGQVRVLSSPKVMALNNQVAVIKVVDEQVYFTLELSEDRNSEGEISSRQYTSKLHTVPVGLVLQVLPQVAADGVIALNVRPTITNIRSWVEDPAVALLSRDSGNPVSSKVPVLQVREMDATLRVRSGQLAMLGGLIQDSQGHQRAGWPGLSRLPVVGDLFSYRDDTVRRVELVVFLRPLLTGPDGMPGILQQAGMAVPDAQFFASPVANTHPAMASGALSSKASAGATP